MTEVVYKAQRVAPQKLATLLLYTYTYADRSYIRKKLANSCCALWLLPEGRKYLYKVVTQPSDLHVFFF